MSSYVDLNCYFHKNFWLISRGTDQEFIEVGTQGRLDHRDSMVRTVLIEGTDLQSNFSGPGSVLNVAVQFPHTDRLSSTTSRIFHAVEEYFRHYGLIVNAGRPIDTQRTADRNLIIEVPVSLVGMDEAIHGFLQAVAPEINGNILESLAVLNTTQLK